MSHRVDAERAAVRLAYELGCGSEHTNGFLVPLTTALNFLRSAAETTHNDPQRHDFVQSAIKALRDVPTGKL